jgi:hypothetical protein
LDTSLHEVSLQTQHVQDHCSLVLDTFQNLQATSARRERFLLRPLEQQQQKLQETILRSKVSGNSRHPEETPL